MQMHVGISSLAMIWSPRCWWKKIPYFRHPHFSIPDAVNLSDAGSLTAFGSLTAVSGAWATSFSSHHGSPRPLGTVSGALECCSFRHEHSSETFAPCSDFRVLCSARFLLQIRMKGSSLLRKPSEQEVDLSCCMGHMGRRTDSTLCLSLSQTRSSQFLSTCFSMLELLATAKTMELHSTFSSERLVMSIRDIFCASC